MLKGYLYNIASILMMGIGPLLSKFGLLHISISMAAAINAITIILASYIWGLISKKHINIYLTKDVTILAICNSIGVVLMYISLDLLSPVQVGFLGRFYTVFAVVLSFVILKEKITSSEWSLIVLAIIGTFMFITPSDNGIIDILGIISAILYTFFFALSNVLIKITMTDGRDSNSLLFTNNLWTLLIIALYLFIFNDNWNLSISGVGLTALAALMTGFLGTLFLYEALKRIRFSIANVMRATSPIILAIVSYPFFPIKLTFFNIFGAVVLILSILIIGIVDFQKRIVVSNKNEHTKELSP
ncbi:DMT family transporter [Metabacillus fastidiosus]|uniref:DMT family transporter n=1 Tax=Metabacillus fastidiosus TaxID=1458 RepID=UPI002E2144DD|nr:DMT family transporter [Metabacillus fastidiosus]